MSVSNLKLKVFGLLAFTLVCVLTFLYLFQSAGGRLRLNDPYNAKALVPDTFNIVPNADVRKDGVKIGRVKTVEPKGAIGEVKFEIEKEDHAVLYRDATVKVRTKTLVGESYLDVSPGTASTGELPSGATLPLEQTEESVPLERILSSVDEETRKDIQRNMKGLGPGVGEHGGDLNRLFGAMKPAVAESSRLLRVLEPQKEQLATLINDTGEVLQALGERDAAFRGLVTDAKRTAEVVAERDDKLAELIDELEPTLDRAESSVAKLAGFSGRATPVVRDLKVASRHLAPTVRDLEPAARDGRKLFAELEPFLDRLDPLLTELKPASGALKGLVQPLDAVLRQVNPMANYLKDYDDELAAFFSNTSDIVSRDRIGNRGRVFPVVNVDSLTGFNSIHGKLVESLIAAGGAQAIYNPRANPYPKPGTVGNEQDFDGKYTRVEADK